MLTNMCDKVISYQHIINAELLSQGRHETTTQPFYGPEVTSIQSLPAPPTHQGDSRLRGGWGTPVHVWYGCPHLATG